MGLLQEHPMCATDPYLSRPNPSPVVLEPLPHCELSKTRTPGPCSGRFFAPHGHSSHENPARFSGVSMTRRAKSQSARAKTAHFATRSDQRASQAAPLGAWLGTRVLKPGPRASGAARFDQPNAAAREHPANRARLGRPTAAWARSQQRVVFASVEREVER